MKRFVSLILSVCFLFSINTVSYAASCSRVALSAAPELLFGQFCTCAFGKPEEKSLT